MNTLTQSTVAPLVTAFKEDTAQWFLGSRIWMRASAAQTTGAMGLIEQVVPPGFGSPYHVHHNEDEAFYVLDGEIRFFSGANSWVAGPGGFAFLPRDIPHGFRTEGNVPSRSLLLVTPAGFESFVAELSSPTPPAGPPDLEKLAQVAATYGVDILGPLPEQANGWEPAPAPSNGCA